jgi:peptidoglycan/LPS O-acetylase OafA/YrhL
MKELKKVTTDYFENLDGLRFICFLSIFINHSFYTEFDYIISNKVYQFLKFDLFENTNLGVNFFFVLSGFLITYLLVNEKLKYGNIVLKNFWMRRVLRIWPLFYFCVFFGFIIFPFLKELLGQVSMENASPYMYILFLNNFDYISKGLPDSSALAVLWTVAIEEQFYLIWPVIIYIFPVKKLWMPFSLIIGLSFIIRAYYNLDVINECHTLSVVSDMVVGAFGALFILQFTKFKAVIIEMKRWVIIGIYVMLVVIFMYRQELLMQNYWINIFERFIISLVICAIILEQCYAKNSFYKMSNFKQISRLGLITYGLYCLHFIAILIVNRVATYFEINKNIWSVLILETIAGLILSIVISYLSYKYFEKPILKFKDKFIRK